MAWVIAFDGLELTYVFFPKWKSAWSYIEKESFFLIMMCIAKVFSVSFIDKYSFG